MSDTTPQPDLPEADPEYIEPVTAEELNELAPAALHDDDCTGEPEADTEDA